MAGTKASVLSADAFSDYFVGNIEKIRQSFPRMLYSQMRA